jgi:shikimate 5-dehydrogenase
VLNKEDFVTKIKPTFYFVGVTTASSSIMRVFPLWMRELSRSEVVIEGVDLALHDMPERYRQVVAQIKYDPLSIGALVTTHKIDLFDAAEDMFDVVGPYARLCREISCILKRDDSLVGQAKDPISAGLSLDAVLGTAYFGRTGGEVLCFGAGGAAVAIAVHLAHKEASNDRPKRFAVVNRSPGRLERLRAIVDDLGTDISFEYICNRDPQRNDRIMADMPKGSLVINATGMGKDRPGSPVTDAGMFPVGGVAWELNYRGELGFLRQASAQKEARHVTVEDGWLYFLYGWTEAIAEVLGLDIGKDQFLRLGQIAAQVREQRKS